MTRRAEVVVGAAILLGLLLIGFGTFWLKGGRFGREERVVYARFREIGLLLEGNAVKLRGVPIGEVEDVVLEEGGNGVLVSLRIDDQVSLPDDPVVLLSPESMFGDWKAEIVPRSRYPRFVYAEAADPDVLPGYSLPDIGQITQVADRIAENLAVLSERVQIAFTEETAVRLRTAIENIQEVSEQLTGLVQRQQRTLDALAGDLASTTQTLEQAAEAVRGVAAQVEAAVAGGQLAGIVTNIQAATAQVDSLTGALVLLSNDFRSAIGSVDSAFQSLEVITGAAAQGRGTLGRMLQDTTLYGQIVQTNTMVQALIKDFQANPRKYINLSIF
ncbi:MAG: MCE family protein [Gemmatimonadetes bacterium]|nr:MCE family protein [Gemmatimonadota bacterium]